MVLKEIDFDDFNSILDNLFQLSNKVWEPKDYDIKGDDYEIIPLSTFYNILQDKHLFKMILGEPWSLFYKRIKLIYNKRQIVENSNIRIERDNRPYIIFNNIIHLSLDEFMTKFKGYITYLEVIMIK